jgi:D-alanyl-lipoteichoic acid acyltransferase DltB (MBOAT superfamily)
MQDYLVYIAMSYGVFIVSLGFLLFRALKSDKARKVALSHFINRHSNES